jgi:hypothetical protein
MNRPCLALAFFVLAALPCRAQTGYPMVSRIEPVAIQRGKAVELSFGNSGNGSGAFTGAFALLCEGPGLKGEVLSVETPTPTPAKTKGRGMRRPTGVVKARLTAAPDAPLGPREVRVATPQGVSSVGLVVVVNDPVVAEKDDKADDDARGAQALELPCAVAGTIGKLEDVDWYAVPAKAGQRLTFSVWANRLENKIHDLQLHFDPILQLFNAAGRELAADDNHDFADPLLSFEFKQDGTYYVQVRDTTYGGNANWTYVLQATAGPVATSIFPLAVNPGAKATLHAKGPNLDPSEAITLDVASDLAPGTRLVALPTAKGPTLATPIVVTALPVVLEKEDAPEEAEKAQSLTLPAAVCGRLGAANDVDAFRFEAKKGTVYAFEVAARRAGVSTDPVLKLINDKGAAVTEADDTPGLGKDCRLEWTAPGDGAFALVVSDLHNRGGDEFGYVLLAEPARPDFTLTCDPDKLNLGPGGRVPLFVQIKRHAGFDGPVAIDLGALPPGVSASPLTVGAKMTQGVVVVSADRSAKPAAALLSLHGKADASGGPLVRAVSARQEIYMPGGGRNTYPVETLALAVTDPSDITVEASPKTIALAPGGTATIDVSVTRKEGFEQSVNLAIVLEHLGGVHANPLPPGVTVREAGSKTLLGPKETKGKLILQAAAGAKAIENVPISVMGHVSINFVVKTAYASEPIAVSVSPK